MFPERVTCLSLFTLVLVVSSSASGVTANADVWSKFEATRQGARALHQQFEVQRRVKGMFAEQSSKHQIVIDIAQGKWREQAIGGDGELTRLFDGNDLFVFESDGAEYTRPKKKANEPQLPEPYDTKVDWNKAKEINRMPCGFEGRDHTCVVLDAPVKPWLRFLSGGRSSKMNQGTIRVMIDTETGIWLRCNTVLFVEGSRSDYQMELSYSIKDMSYGAAPDDTLFHLPDSLHEVKELTPWNEARIRKQLGGKPAPDLQVTDIKGNPITLASLKGKTILLDFWTTWCPPCQSDASSVEKLNQKYGNKNLAIIGISVEEDRETVEKYLKKHPHSYPVVLSSENQMPRPYEIGVFPTYLIIGPDGTLMSAQEGDQGFGKLRKDLQKAGMDVD